MVRTDHKALVNAINNGTGEHSLHEQGMINYITEFGPYMQHIPGKDNPVADSLSRPNRINLNNMLMEDWHVPPVEEFARYQNEDPELAQEIEKIKRAETHLTIITRAVDDGILYGVADQEQGDLGFRPVVPKLLQAAVFHLHPYIKE